MASILDNAVLLGLETTYGTKASSITRGYEAKADSWKRTQEFLDSTGIRAGLQAQRSDRSRPINMGGEGSIEADVLNSGFGLLFSAMFGKTTGPTAGVATFETDSTDSGQSFTVQVLRTDVGGTTRCFTHLGAVVTGWTIAQEVGGLLVATLNFDFQDVVTNETAGTPSYPAGAVPFDWTMASATWGGSPIEPRSFSLEADLAMNVERRLLRGSALKKQPVRSGVPTYEGSMECEFESLDVYADFVAGTVDALVIEWDNGDGDELKIEMPAVQFTGESPEVSTDNLPVQNLPFKALDNGSDPVVTLTYTTGDTTL